MHPKTIALLMLWLGFVIYAFGFAPPNQPDTLDLIINLSTSKTSDLNPLVVALFNIMGILPMMYGCFLFFDGRGQNLPAWLFTLGSFALGAFALLPYLALRQPYPTFSGPKNWFLKALDASWVGIVIAITALTLLAYGVTQGDWHDFVEQWQTDRFIHVMSLDFCLLSLLFPTLLKDDMARRGWHNPLIFWAIALVPLLGPIAYLTLRPPTQSSSDPAPAPPTLAKS